MTPYRAKTIKEAAAVLREEIEICGAEAAAAETDAERIAIYKKHLSLIRAHALFLASRAEETLTETHE